MDQIANSGPGMMIGKDAFSSVEFNGTLFVDTAQDDDFIGIVFNYQSNKRFMLVTWKKRGQTYYLRNPFTAEAKAGLEIKVVRSQTGPGKMLRNSIWKSGTTKKQVGLVENNSHILFVYDR